ncbi:MAG: ribonuclease III [Ignavibacteriales bacterium]|nr:ribonuclease III [Ignavibacteriales bacterium]
MNTRLLNLLKKIISSKKFKFSEYPENFSDILLEKLSLLEKLLGYKIKDPTFYIKALTHRSYNEFTDFNLRSNERLEYLGDSVLSLLIAEYLFKKFPKEDEGFLTKTRSKLVNRNALAKAAERINLLDYMLVSNSFLSISNGVATIVSNAIEALIGAIYIDAGIDAARKFIELVIIKPGTEDNGIMEDKNFKSQLLEYTQANRLENPYYKIVKEDGPNHAKVFTVEVYVDNNCLGSGTGKNKKEAEQNAAKLALSVICEIKISELN